MLKQTEREAEPSALRWSYSWVRRTENLTFTSGPDPGSGRRREGGAGAGPALTPVLLLVMALITAPGHDHVFVIVCWRFF